MIHFLPISKRKYRDRVPCCIRCIAATRKGHTGRHVHFASFYLRIAQHSAIGCECTRRQVVTRKMHFCFRKRVHHKMECPAADGGGGAIYPHGALYAPVRAADGELGDGPRESWAVFVQDVLSRPVYLCISINSLGSRF